MSTDPAEPDAARGVSISLEAPELTPPKVLHYEFGPRTYRQFLFHGIPWLAI